MNEFKKYFPQGVDGLLDDAVKAIVKQVGDGLEFAEFLVLVMSMGMRRLKVLFCPEEMGAEEKAVPAFSAETIPFLTDEEIKAGFYPFSPMDKAKFVMSVRKADGPVVIRFNALLEQMKNSEQATREANQAAIARRAQEEADRARKAADEAETKRVRRDDEAMAYIAKAPNGRFQTVADLDALIEAGEDCDEVFDWVHRKMILVGDAMVVGKCLITNKETANRLAEKLRRPKDKNRPLAFTIERTREWLAQCEKENEAAREREEEERQAELTAMAKFAVEVRDAFAKAETIPDKVLVKNQLEAECGGESWKLDIVRREAETREDELSWDFLQELRERFPHSRCFPELDAFIKEMEAKFLGRSSAEAWPDNVIDGAKRHVGIATRHRQWLEDNPRGVVQPRPGADVIDLAGMWESSSGRKRPKFGPGSGIGGQKREKTQEERLIHRGRQLAFGDRRFWEGKFGKSVEKFTDDDFKKVVEIFGDVKGDRKAAKKQGGRN